MHLTSAGYAAWAKALVAQFMICPGAANEG
jgi:hypothetical protein